MLSKSFLALAAGASCVAAQAKGFNYASQGVDQQAFTNDLASSKSLKNATGFNSLRLYTMIQDGTTNTPISAIPAALDNEGTLLLGLWASAGQAAFDNEIAALKNAIEQYGKKGLADAVVGISCGSEDLYRITDTSTIVNKDPNPGAQPDTIVNYIKQVRNAIKGTVLADTPVGHVDTYTAFINSSNQDVIDNCDFLGMDAYPYYQTTVDNSIDNAKDLFFSAYDQTKAAAGDAQVWVTETGWPYADKSGKTYNKAVASVKNAQRYWKEVACQLIASKTNTWWFTLASGEQPAFGIRGNSIDNEPLWDLSCDDSDSSSDSSSSSYSSSSPSKTGSSTKSSGSSSSSSSSSDSSSSDSSSDSSSGDDSSDSRSGSDSSDSSSSDSSSSGSDSDSSSSSGSSGSDSSSGSGSDSSSSSGSSGSGSGSGAAPYPAGSNSTAAGTGGVNTPTPSSTNSAVPSSFTGAANRNAEIGAGAAAVLGLLSCLL